VGEPAPDTSGAATSLVAAQPFQSIAVRAGVRVSPLSSRVFGSYHRDDDQGDLADLRLRKVLQLAHMTQGPFDGDLIHVSTVRTFSRASIMIWSMKSSTVAML
jgi:hypothetical protein